MGWAWRFLCIQVSCFRLSKYRFVFGGLSWLLILVFFFPLFVLSYFNSYIFCFCHLDSIWIPFSIPFLIAFFIFLHSACINRCNFAHLHM